jgi:hypothetical protein
MIRDSEDATFSVRTGEIGHDSSEERNRWKHSKETLWYPAISGNSNESKLLSTPVHTWATADSEGNWISLTGQAVRGTGHKSTLGLCISLCSSLNASIFSSTTVSNMESTCEIYHHLDCQAWRAGTRSRFFTLSVDIWSRHRVSSSQWVYYCRGWVQAIWVTLATSET